MSPALLLVVRNLSVSRRSWLAFLSGFAEPLFYLLSIGLGVGTMIAGFDVNGHRVGYADFVAPAMLATSAANGAIMEATFTVHLRLRHTGFYDAILATPAATRDLALGELTWAVLRGGVYGVAFLGVMALLGYVHSWWALVALPAALLVGYAFAGVGLWATTYVRTWQDFEYLSLALMPMVLFSGTFFPIDALPAVVRPLVEITPLYRGVVLCRELTTVGPGLGSVVSVVYLAGLGALGLALARRRFAGLLVT